MKKIIYLLVIALLFAAGCSKKEKKVIPFSSLGGDAATSTTASGSGGGSAIANVTGATLSQINVSPADQSIAKDTHATYTATAVYSDGTIKDISNECTWTVKSETDKATADASVKGRFRGVGVTSIGSSVKVNASFGAISGDANLKITNVTLTSIQITSVPSITPGGTTQYVATGIFSDGTTQDVTSLVTWSSSNASSVTVDPSTGKGTGGSSSGTAIITATLTNPATFPSATNGDVATTTTALTNVTIVLITISGVSSVSAGSTANYVASATYSDGTSADITSQATWSVTSAANASINDSTGSKGVLTTISVGSTNIQVSFSGLTGTKAVTISDATVVSVVVSPSTKSIAKGTTTQFTAIATYSDGTTRDVTNSVVWSSSSASVAGVTTSSTTGGAAQGIDAGSSVITATIGGKSASASLTVSAATLVSIAINGNTTIAKGTTKQYSATGTYSDGSTQDITSLVSWSSSSASNVSISNGTGTKGLATGAGQGSSTIQASLSGINSNTSTLSVSAATLDSIAIGANTSVENGSTKQYTAIGTYSDGTTQDITTLVTWASATEATATISNSVGQNGKASSLAIGTSSITASVPNGANGISTTSGGTVTSNTSVLTVAAAAAAATTTNSTVSGYNVTMPSGLSTVEPAVGGTGFTGITYQGNPAEVAGFVSTVDYTAGVGCTNFGTTLMTTMSTDSPDVISVFSQVTSNVIGTNPNCSAVYSLAVTTNADQTVTSLSNHLIAIIGKKVPGGTITNLPSSGTNSPTTTFRVILQATYSETGSELVGVGVSREADYANNATLLASLLDGTNINPTGSTNTAKTDTFTATADPKVDFVWVVDNSGSMKEEQTSVSNNASTFFNKLKAKHLDFRLGVLATGNEGTRKGNELWGSSQDGSKWVYKADTDADATFKANVDSTTITGSGVESGIYYAQRALGGGPSPVAATVVPRSGAKLVFVMLTDEGDNYQCYTGGSYPTVNGKSSSSSNPTCTGGTAFNTADNIFTQNGYKVYSVIGIHDGTLTNTSGISIGQPGKCDSNTASDTAPKATNANNGYPLVYNLAAATGGSSGSICSTDYTSLLDNIATQAAGSASTYVLAHTPVSSTIAVKVNGATVAQDATNGWSYNSATKTIVFSGTAWPTAGAAISVSYEYNSSVAFMENIKDNNLMAYISKTASSDSARGAAAAVALLVGAILAGRIWSNRKNK